jgi:hypothetical protein
MYVVIAVVLGLVVGLARGGWFTHLGERSFRWVWLLVAGVFLQVLTEVFHLPKTADVVTVLVSYASLALFAARNLDLAGMGVVAIGLVLNIVPIAVNQGMPVRGSAIIESKIASNQAGLAHLSFGGKRHLATASDHLMVLSDIVPDPVFHEVLSFGDLAMSVGIAAVVVNLLRPPRRRRSANADPSVVGAEPLDGGGEPGPTGDPASFLPAAPWP